ncbi:MAG: hypothetical protein DRJ65_22800 [Acidobacteria bacterium]|nr:MAG: hypothetical protein DRJ65_22800 [Acidobacteriota bacterium]
MTHFTVLNVAVVLSLAVFAPALADTGWSFEPPDLSDSAVTMTEGEYEALAKDFSKSYTSPLNVPAAAFRSDGVNPDRLLYHLHFDEIRGLDVANAYAVAPVYLPNGATVSMVGVQVFDGIDTTGPCGDDPLERNVEVYLFRVDNYSGESFQMAGFSTTGSDPDSQYFVEMSVEYPVVLYPDYSYFAVTKVCSSAHAFSVMQIFYTVD